MLIRDRMGIKPLYVYRTPDGVLFGSEPKAILANPLARRAVDADGLRELFAFVKTPRHAIWAGMREVEPGTVVTVDARRHARAPLLAAGHAAHEGDTDATVAHVRELLEDIVRRQLISDVPRCVLLSGGLDSSAITALAAAVLAETGERCAASRSTSSARPRTSSPTRCARRRTRRTCTTSPSTSAPSTRHRARQRRRWPIPGSGAAVIAARDLPTGLGDMDASLYLLCKAIREHSTVALSGESADEVFGGYRQFHDPRIQQADDVPVAGAGRRRCDRRRRDPRAGLAAALDLPGYRRDAYETAVAEVEHLRRRERPRAPHARVSSYLHLTRFVRYLLDRKDRMSMAVGLEVRVPFCDHRLVEYVYNAPWSLKTFDGREKSPAARRDPATCCRSRWSSASRARTRRPRTRTTSPRCSARPGAARAVRGRCPRPRRPRVAGACDAAGRREPLTRPARARMDAEPRGVARPLPPPRRAVTTNQERPR